MSRSFGKLVQGYNCFMKHKDIQNSLYVSFSYDKVRGISWEILFSVVYVISFKP